MTRSWRLCAVLALAACTRRAPAAPDAGPPLEFSPVHAQRAVVSSNAAVALVVDARGQGLVFEVARGEVTRFLPPPDGRCSAHLPALSGDGRVAAIASCRQVELRSVDDAASLGVLPAQNPTALALSHDGGLLALASEAGVRVGTRAGWFSTAFESPSGVHSLAFSGDGARLALCGQDEAPNPKGFERYGMVVTPRLCVDDVATGRSSSCAEGHLETILGFTRDGGQLIGTSLDDGDSLLVDPTTGEVKTRVGLGSPRFDWPFPRLTSLQAVSLSADRELLVISTPSEVLVFHTADGSLASRLRASVGSSGLGAGGRRVIVPPQDGRARSLATLEHTLRSERAPAEPLVIYELETGRALITLAPSGCLPPQPGLPERWLSEDGRFATTLCRDGVLPLWDAQSGEVTLLPGHRATLTAIAFSDDGASLAAGDETGLVTAYRLADLAPLGSLTVHGSVASISATALGFEVRSDEPAPREWAPAPVEPRHAAAAILGAREGEEWILRAGELPLTVRALAEEPTAYLTAPDGHFELFGTAPRLDFVACRLGTGPLASSRADCLERFRTRGLLGR